MRLLIEGLDALEAGDKQTAHDIAQTGDGAGASWLHAHIHRIEGDDENARYWYSKAGMEPYEGDVTEERFALREALTSGTSDT